MAIFKTACTFKKQKFVDDLLIAKQVQAIKLRDKQLIEKDRTPLKTKTQIKKAASGKKNLADKQTKTQENAKNKTKARALNLMRLATANKRVEEIGTFNDIFSNLANRNKSLDNITLTPTLFAILPLEKLQ